jgi:hypothetical protein
VCERAHAFFRAKWAQRCWCVASVLLACIAWSAPLRSWGLMWRVNSSRSMDRSPLSSTLANSSSALPIAVASLFPVPEPTWLRVEG